MSEPKFHVGQKVAVLTAGLEVVLPTATVSTVSHYGGGMRRHPITNVARQVPACWQYQVAESPYPDICYGEWCLRPLKDDDYTIETEEQELSHE